MWYAELNHTSLFSWASLYDMLSCSTTASHRRDCFGREAALRKYCREALAHGRESYVVR